MSVQPATASPADNRAGDHLSPAGFDYNRIDGVSGNRNVTPEFISAVEGMAQRLGTHPEYLLAVMSFETGGSFSPAQPNNAGGSATGLIQFMPDTARELGTSTDALARMSSVDQLQFVERYFNNRSDPGDLNTLEGVYTTVLHGSPRPDADATLFSQGTSAYSANAALDINRDGRITSGEATSFVRSRIDGDVPPSTSTPPGSQSPPVRSPADPQPPTSPGTSPAPAPSASIHTVLARETLSGIAEANKVSLQSLLAANPQFRANPNLIHPGDQVRIPGGSVTVERGDTLSGIASTHDISLSALIRANPQISNPNLIHPGQMVHLPGGSPATSAPPTVTPPASTPSPVPPSGDTPAPSGTAPSYAPYTVYSTGARAAFTVDNASQLQPHHDYTSKVRDGQTLQVRDVVLAHPGQSQTAQPIPAPMAGEVIHAGPLGTAGNAVILRGDGGQLVYLFHMSSTDVRVGQQVQYGQALGNQGSTGHSTGPHVHIEASQSTVDRWVNDLVDGRFDGHRG